MSSKDVARHASAAVTFNGTDISKDIAPYLLSISYTDKEEDGADDLQIKLQDREDTWLSKWLDDMIETYSGVSVKTTYSTKKVSLSTYPYTVNVSSGLWCRYGPGTGWYARGSYAYRDEVPVYCICRGWAAVSYWGKMGFCYASYLTRQSTAAYSLSQVSYGSKGYSVKICQQKLKALGYNLGWYGVDGVYGSYTRSAVRAFQKNVGIAVDGVCGPHTFGWLFYKTDAGTKTVTTSATSVQVKGMPIEASITRHNWQGDGKDDTLKMGLFELDSLKASGPPNTVTIKGTSLFYSSAIRQTERDKAWENYYLSGIAREVAKRGGLDFRYDSKSNPYYSRVEQTSQSDISFLVDLVHRAGISMKIYNNTLILFDQATYEAKNPVRTFKRGDGSYEKWDMETNEADCKYDSCKVYYTDPKTKKKYSAWAYADDYDKDADEHQVLYINQRVTSNIDAQALAVKMLRMKNKFEYEVKLTIPGDPAMVAGVTVRLSGWGTFSGKYIIKQSKHTLSRSSGYSTQITCRKVQA